jgi:hypothetical protein
MIADLVVNGKRDLAYLVLRYLLCSVNIHRSVSMERHK